MDRIEFMQFIDTTNDFAKIASTFFDQLMGLYNLDLSADKITIIDNNITSIVFAAEFVDKTKYNRATIILSQVKNVIVVYDVAYMVESMTGEEDDLKILITLAPLQQ